MATTLRDELASLKIERSESVRPSRVTSSNNTSEYRRRGGGGLRLLSWMLWLIPLGIIAGAGTVAYRQYDQIRSKTEVTLGLVQLMTTGEAEKLLSAKGYLKSQKQAMIGTKVAGRVDQMLVQEHDLVKEGQLLAVIEHHDLDAMIEQREASMDRARGRAGGGDGRGLAEEARRAAGRAVAGQEDGPSGGLRQGQGQPGHEPRPRSRRLSASIKVMEANLKEMRYTLRYQMEIHAPFNGTVVEKQGEVGEIISPMAMSSSLGRSAVVTIADLQHMDVETDISENMMARVQLSQPAEVSVSANPHKRYQGRLRQIIPMGDRTRGTVKVKVEILDPDDKLFPDLAATVHFLPFKSGPQAETNKAFLFVPKSAVFQENGLDYVWVVDKQKSIVNKRQVEVAATREDLARVESGLKAEESVVLNPPKTLKDKEVVKVPDSA